MVRALQNLKVKPLHATGPFLYTWNRNLQKTSSFLFSGDIEETSSMKRLNISIVLVAIFKNIYVLLNPFVPNTPFLYPLKTSENCKVSGFRN